MMKRFGSVLLTLFAGIHMLYAGHVPQKVMHHYCTEVAAATYEVPLQRVDAHMPAYRKKGFNVHGEITHSNGIRERFLCRYDERGRFQFIRKERRNSSDTINRRIRHACKTEASVRWHVPPREITIGTVRKLGHGHFEISLNEAERSGICRVNTQGYVSRFQTFDNERQTPRAAEYGCIKKAASRWNVPTAYIRIENTDYLGRGHYLLKLSDDRYTADCEVKNTGAVYRFTEHYKPERWR
jgi:hypothetical protein